MKIFHEKFAEQYIISIFTVYKQTNMEIMSRKEHVRLFATSLIAVIIFIAPLLIAIIASY